MKTLDFKNLPNGTLIERRHEWEPAKYTWLLGRMGEADLQYYQYRLATDVWHFNDGSMVLPDGLVVMAVDRDRDQEVAQCKTILQNKEMGFFRSLKYEESKLLSCCDIIALKVLGVTEDFREAGEALGYEVINAR